MGRSSEETKLSKKIRDKLDLAGVWWIRIQSGRIQLKHGGFMYLAAPGCPDLWCKHGFLEVKDLAKLSPEQLAWHDRARREGVNVAVVHSPEEALDIIEKWKKEKRGNMTENNNSLSKVEDATANLQKAISALRGTDEFNRYLEAVDELQEVTSNFKKLDDGAIGSDIDNAITVTELSNDAIDNLVISALVASSSVNTAISAEKIAKSASLNVKDVSKALKRITNVKVTGVRRGTKYYIEVSCE